VRIPFKFDLLAKLREFKKGTNVTGYLMNEQKQNLKAIQESFVEMGGVPVLICSIPDVITFVTSQRYVLTSANTYLMNDIGTLKSGAWFPKTDGKYFIEYGFLASIGSAAGAYSPNVTMYDTNDNLVDQLAAFNVHTIGNYGYFHPNTGLFIDVTTTKGIYFIATLGSAIDISKFYCKITALS
jgi:hypothetical protein